jgi:hypothetical protein
MRPYASREIRIYDLNDREDQEISFHRPLLPFHQPHSSLGPENNELIPGYLGVVTYVVQILAKESEKKSKAIPVTGHGGL